MRACIAWFTICTAWGLGLVEGGNVSTTDSTVNGSYFLSIPSSPVLDVINSTTCDISLANNKSYASLLQTFQSLASGGVVCVVYFKLKTQLDNGSVVPFSISGSDTFAADAWVWATSKGKNLLRMPLDNAILSLGLLTLNTINMDIVFDQSTTQCMETKPYAYTSHLVAKYIAQNVTANGTTVGMDTDGPVVCRSAFAFTHRMFGEKGIGFKCCSAPVDPGQLYDCNAAFTASWELVWYGPIVLMCWIYAIAFIHFYKLYSYAFVKQKIRQLSGLEQTIEEIKQDVVSRIVRMSERLARIKNPDALIALRERCAFLDVLGVNKTNHSKITGILRILFVAFLLASYYGVCVIFLYVYNLQLKDVLVQINETKVAYLNVVGHFGWVFCRHDINIFSYAVFEMIYTALLPIFAAIVYVSIIYRHDAKSFAEDPGKFSGQRFKQLILRVISSCFGRFLQVICFVFFFIYVVFLAGVFLTYVVYFVGLGVFANIDVVSPWVIPLVICVHFFATSFNSAYSEYQIIKDLSFSICLDDFKNLVIRKQKEIFLPRELIENFYIPNSRSTIYSCFLRIFWVFAFMLLLVLVVLTLQYPYYHQTTSIVSFLGVQVVFVMPILAQLMYNNNSLSQLEESILKRDIHEYIKKYVKDHPDIGKIQQPSNVQTVAKVEDTGSTDDELDNYRNGEVEPDIGFINVSFHEAHSESDLIASKGQELLEMIGIKNPYSNLSKIV